MSPKTVRRLRARINEPGYYADRCYQMMEIAGDWSAEALLFRYGPRLNVPQSEHTKVWHRYNIKSEMYKARARWYALQAARAYGKD